MYYKTRLSIRKAIALSFLFLANTMILVHAVIPHHHHDGLTFMLTGVHQRHDCNSHNDHHNCNDAQSGKNCNYPLCDGNIEDCALATIYVRFGNDRPSSQLHDFDFELLPCIFILFFEDFEHPIADDVGLPFRQNPLVPSQYPEYISQSLGLRAPPVC